MPQEHDPLVPRSAPTASGTDGATVRAADGDGTSPVRRTLIALAAGAFVIGCSEFVVVGLLPEIATALEVSAAAVGQLLTVYALAVALLAPVLLAGVASRSRRAVLLGALAAFVVSQVAAALAPNYAVLLAARVISGAAFGVYLGAALGVAAATAGPAGRGRAVGTVISGVTIATAIGVPLGTVLGQGAGWRAPFAVIAGLGVVAAVAVARTVANAPAPPGPGLRERLGVLRDRKIVLGLGAGALFWAAVFTAFTYLVPILNERTGLSGHAVTGVLLLAGLMSVAGNIIGARAADRALGPTLLGTAAASALGLALLSVTTTTAALAVVSIAIWQFGAWSFVPAIQSRVVGVAGAAGELVGSLSVSALNIGIVLGGLVGGVVVSVLGTAWVAPVATVLGIIALAVVAVSLRDGTLHPVPAVDDNRTAR